MRRSFQKRWVTIFAASLWFSAAVLHGLTPLVSGRFLDAPTDVETSAIEFSGTSDSRQGTCHHHPQGCPADCFCPKTGSVGEGGEEASPSVEKADFSGVRLNEMAWAECSESRAAAAPAFAVYLPEHAREISVFEISQAFVIPEPAPVRSVFRAPPAKIPIV